MAQVRSTVGACDLSAHHAKGTVLVPVNCSLKVVVECWPAAARVELCVGPAAAAAGTSWQQQEPTALLAGLFASGSSCVWVSTTARPHAGCLVLVVCQRAPVLRRCMHARSPAHKAVHVLVKGCAAASALVSALSSKQHGKGGTAARHVSSQPVHETVGLVQQLELAPQVKNLPAAGAQQGSLLPLEPVCGTCSPPTFS